MKQMGELISWKLVPLMTRLDVRRERDYDFEWSAAKVNRSAFGKRSRDSFPGKQSKSGMNKVSRRRFAVTSSGLLVSSLISDCSPGPGFVGHS